MFLKGQFTPNASLSLLCQRFCYTLANCWWKSAVMPGYIPWELFSCSYRTHTHWDSSQPKTINEMWEQQRLIMCLFITTFLILLCWSFTALPYPSLVVNSPKKVVTVTYTHRKWPCSERGDCHFLNYYYLPLYIYILRSIFLPQMCFTELWIIWLATNRFLRLKITFCFLWKDLWVKKGWWFTHALRQKI